MPIPEVISDFFPFHGKKPFINWQIFELQTASKPWVWCGLRRGSHPILGMVFQRFLGPVGFMSPDRLQIHAF